MFGDYMVVKSSAFFSKPACRILGKAYIMEGEVTRELEVWNPKKTTICLLARGCCSHISHGPRMCATQVSCVYIYIYCTYTGWWQLKHFLYVHPDPWKKWFQFDEHIFSNGLVQPPIGIYIYIMDISLGALGFQIFRWVGIWTPKYIYIYSKKKRGIWKTRVYYIHIFCIFKNLIRLYCIHACLILGTSGT